MRNRREKNEDSAFGRHENGRLMIATEPDWVRAAIEKHRAWIESVQGVSMDRLLVLHGHNHFTCLPALRILADVPLAVQEQGPTAKMRDEVLSVEYPKGYPPTMNVETVSKRDLAIGERQDVWQVGWCDTPVAIRFPQLRGAIIAIKIPYQECQSTSWSETVICRQDEVAVAMELMRESNVIKDEGKVQFSTGGYLQMVNSSSWEHLVLDPMVLKLVKNDYESFFAREKWFRDLNLPFRRGYLLHGSPGNGKTSVVRAMLSRPGMRGFTLNFFSPNVDDDDLQRMFQRAAEEAPSMVVMEDIDRAFPKDQSSGTKTKLSLQQLLNCLDGVGTEDGVVVVATANEPTALDPAILRRPGRFDRVVAFPNPTPQLRLQYLRRLNCNFTEQILKPAIDLSEGFSFAQMREAYIMAGQQAFERKSELNPADITMAIRILRHGMAATSQPEFAAGFGARLLRAAESSNDESCPAPEVVRMLT
jgi:hypothetical protein